MTLKKKILAGYGVAFSLMVLVIVWAVVNLISLGQAANAILRENYRSILAAENMVDALERQDRGLLLMFLGDVKDGITQFRNNETVFLEWFTRAKDNITIPGEADLLIAIKADYDKYLQGFSKITDLAGNHIESGQPSLNLYKDSILPIFNRVRNTCIQLRHLNEETMYKAGMRANQVAKTAIGSTVLVAASALIAALIFSILLARKIVRPLGAFMEASRRISTGDYSVQVPVETHDELGLLAGEFNRMTAQLDNYHEMNIEQIIAEKKKGEAILASIEDALLVFDTDLRVTGINPAAGRVLGLSLSDHYNLRCSDILKNPDLCKIMHQTLKTGRPTDILYENRIITIPDHEEEHHYHFSVTPIGRKGHFSGIVLLLRDVTRLKEVERLKSEFITAASHELRTPLTSLGMSIDLLLEKSIHDLPERDQKLLQAAHEEVNRMKALVNDLLDLSHIEDGKIDLDFENVPVFVLFDHVREVFKRQIDISNIQLMIELPENMPKVRADANKITWVLTNLISNAIRYVGEQGHIMLAANQIGAYVHFSVQDDGPGIPPEYQSKIFEKFVQIRGRETGGTGLGLSICKEIVRAHGGSIWVESEAGKGSTFTFILPAWRNGGIENGA